MGKRSSFVRRERDCYDTPFKGVVPLLPHLADGTLYYEPCAGSGMLWDHLKLAGHACMGASDIAPRRDNIFQRDAFTLISGDIEGSDVLITNPPWDRKILHPMIEHFRTLAPAWLLLDADWAHTKRAAPYMKYCHKIVSVGRLKWIPESKYTGKENCAWYYFTDKPGVPEFYGRISG